MSKHVRMSDKKTSIYGNLILRFPGNRTESGTCDSVPIEAKDNCAYNAEQLAGEATAFDIFVWG